MSLTTSIATHRQTITETEVQIKALEEQLEALRQFKSEQEAQTQALLSTKQAMDSAKQQLLAAIAMVNQISPEDLADEEKEITEMFKQPIELLTSSESSTNSDIEVI